ncbi:MAG TPA: hypothetical protein VFZ01_14860 [Geminicoccaceae bacterium]
MSLIAGLWGFAEATLFFIVPDVWLSVVAVMRGAREALVAALWAVAGATAGGALMYLWGATDPAGAAQVLGALPAIEPAMLARVRSELEAEGVVALFAGAFTGTPYKLYAALAPAAGADPWLLLVLTPPARFGRFALTSLLAAGVSRLLARRLSRGQRLTVLACVWVVFYALYFNAHAAPSP